MEKISITKEHNGPEQDLGEFYEAGIRFGRSLDERVLPGARITARGNELAVELQYPECDGDLSREAICVEMCHVRATTGFTVRFDFERDGWSITMDRTREFDDGTTEVAVKDEEVAFVSAWNEAPGPEFAATSTKAISLPPGCTIHRQDEWFEVYSREDERGRREVATVVRVASHHAAALPAQPSPALPRRPQPAALPRQR